jgi:deoxyribonuclease I
LYLYTWVDLYPDGTVKSIYSGEEKDPASLIVKDHEIIQEKYDEFMRALRQVDQHQFLSLKELKSIEWKYKFNTEHIVPQSWFHSLEPMKGDLHHLFTCHPGCNIARSNFPYADFTFYKPESETEPIQNHCRVTINDRFEPEHGKGKIARAMLYFLLRYPLVIKKSFRGLIDIPLLIQWHQQFPVTLYGKHRNQSIFMIQGNRNPFIDFPELVEAVFLQ